MLRKRCKRGCADRTLESMSWRRVPEEAIPAARTKVLILGEIILCFLFLRCARVYTFQHQKGSALARRSVARPIRPNPALPSSRRDSGSIQSRPAKIPLERRATHASSISGPVILLFSGSLRPACARGAARRLRYGRRRRRASALFLPQAVRPDAGSVLAQEKGVPCPRILFP
jgi:hypothetical protein